MKIFPILAAKIVRSSIDKTCGLCCVVEKCYHKRSQGSDVWQASVQVCLRIALACACTVHSQLQPFSLQKLLQKLHISAPARPTLRGTVFNGAPSGMDGRSDWAAALSCVQAH